MEQKKKKKSPQVGGGETEVEELFKSKQTKPPEGLILTKKS